MQLETQGHSWPRVLLGGEGRSFCTGGSCIRSEALESLCSSALMHVSTPVMVSACLCMLHESVYVLTELSRQCLSPHPLKTWLLQVMRGGNLN